MTVAVDPRPMAYRVLIDQDWYWAVHRGAPHLVPPRGDRALCGSILPRDQRARVVVGIADHGCRRCLAAAGIEVRP